MTCTTTAWEAGCWVLLDASSNTVFDLTDALGSVLASFNNVASSAAIKGNQVYGPYGNPRDFQGTINTAKGFTGQYNDSLTGLDYYNSRYYDQVAGVFLSADVVQGNGSGENPYGYVGGNPETYNDPTGNCPECVIGIGVGLVVAPEVFVPIVAWSTAGGVRRIDVAGYPSING